MKQKRKEVRTTNTRIKKLRKALDLTQAEFANRLGIRQNTVAKYETDRGTPTRAVVALICREFRVNEDWLRTGNGEMFLPPPADAIDGMIEQYKLPREFRSLIDKYLELKPEQQEAVVEYIRKVAADLMGHAAADQQPPGEKPVPPGYSSRAELEAEADEFAAIAREQFLSEKIPGYQASYVHGSGDLLA